VTRTNSILSLILAALAITVAAAPAAADPGYQTDAFVGPNPALPSTPSGQEPAWRGDAKDLYVQTLAPSQAPVITTEAVGAGFQLGDAVIGALIVSGLLIATLAVARSVARRRRVTAESRV